MVNSENAEEEIDLPDSLIKVIGGHKEDLLKEVNLIDDRMYSILSASNQDFNQPQDQIAASALGWALMGVPYQLYLLGLNSSLILYLHFILETYLRRDAINALNIKNKKVLTKLRNMHLLDYAEILVSEGLMNQKNAHYVKELNQFRNSIAHANIDKLGKFVKSGKVEHLLNIDGEIHNTDVRVYLNGALRLLVDHVTIHIENKRKNSKLKTSK